MNKIVYMARIMAKPTTMNQVVKRECSFHDCYFKEVVCFFVGILVLGWASSLSSS